MAQHAALGQAVGGDGVGVAAERVLDVEVGAVDGRAVHGRLAVDGHAVARAVAEADVEGAAEGVELVREREAEGGDGDVVARGEGWEVSASG